MSIHRYQLRENALIQRKKELWKVKSVSPSHFSAEMVYPRPERPMVCQFMFSDLPIFVEAAAHVVREYEKAWGLTALDKR
jgi:hypothetical protein